MNKTKIVFNSITFAQSGQRALYKNGINSRLIKIAEGQCRHALLINPEKKDKAKKILLNEKLYFSIQEV